MQTIYKKISLEQAKNRFGDSDGKSPWGSVSKDFTIEDKIFFPQEKPWGWLTKEGNTYVLRYGTMLYIQKFLSEFRANSKFYKACKKDDKIYPVEQKLPEFVHTDTDVVHFGKDLQKTIDSESVDYGDYMWISKDYEEFLRIFTIINGESNIQKIKRSEKFLDIFESVKSGSLVGDKIGYFNVSVYLEEEYYEMGQVTAMIEKFVPKKKYAKNSVVYDDNNVVWKLLAEEFSGEAIDDSWTSGATPPPPITITAITESRLFSLKRKKIDYDDNSVALPFNLVYVTGGTEVELAMVDGYFSGGTQYLVKTPMNIIKVDDTYYYDIISSITFDEEVEFIYFIGCNTTGSVSDISYNGVKYTEAYPYTIDIAEFNVSVKDGDANPEKEFKYCNIDYESKRNVDGKIYSDETAYPISYTEANEDFNILYYKSEALMGMEDIKINSENFFIERGKSSAFERHNILGEVSTFEDLRKYKNGYFAMKDDENN